MNKSWKTTIGGAAGALGLAIAAIAPDDPNWVKVGMLVAALGNFAAGLFARDNDKTSEQVNAPQAEGDTQRFIKKPEGMKPI